MPPQGSQAYLAARGILRDYRLDPTREQEYNARQERLNAAEQARLREQGQIAADGLARMGDVFKEGVEGGMNAFYKGKQNRQESDAHNIRMENAQRQQRLEKAEDEFMDAPADGMSLTEEEAGSQAAKGRMTRRQKMMQLQMQKAEEELNQLRKGKGKGAETAAWEKTGELDTQGRPILYNRLTGEEKVLGSAAKADPNKIKTREIVTYDADGNQIIQIVEDTPGQKFSSKPKPTSASEKSPGQDQLDKEFAKDLNQWRGPGKASYAKNRQKLLSAKEKLQAMVADSRDPRGRAGRSTGRLPDEMKDADWVKTRNEVRAASQAALKSALGNNFTEAEGNRIMNASFDENMSPEENLILVDAALQEIDANAKSMDDQADFFQKKKGTLAGYGDNPGAAVAETAPPPADMPPGDGGTAYAGSASKYKDGQTKVIGGVKHTRKNGRWVPDATK